MLPHARDSSLWSTTISHRYSLYDTMASHMLQLSNKVEHAFHSWPTRHAMDNVGPTLIVPAPQHPGALQDDVTYPHGYKLLLFQTLFQKGSLHAPKYTRQCMCVWYKIVYSTKRYKRRSGASVRDRPFILSSFDLRIDLFYSCFSDPFFFMYPFYLLCYSFLILLLLISSNHIVNLQNHLD